jgi:TorA maturation chaperone TorD
MFSRKRFQPGPALPPDHLGTQLAFMADLCWREREAWSQGDFGRAVHWLQEQRTFILEHLAQWVPMLTREVEASDCCAIAKDLMVLLDEFISDEADSIGLWIMQAQMVSETLDHPLTAGKI